MGYTNCKVRQYDTGESTFRRIATGEYIVIICFPHAWRKAHALNASYGQHAKGKVFSSIGQCFEYSKRHYPNCIIGRAVSKPLAKGDAYYRRIADIPVTG